MQTLISVPSKEPVVASGLDQVGAVCVVKLSACRPCRGNRLTRLTARRVPKLLSGCKSLLINLLCCSGCKDLLINLLCHRRELRSATSATLVLRKEIFSWAASGCYRLCAAKKT
jgi:hypothetical protein